VVDRAAPHEQCDELTEVVRIDRAETGGRSSATGRTGEYSLRLDKYGLVRGTRL
jgi:hypothetical protein